MTCKQFIHKLFLSSLLTLASVSLFAQPITLDWLKDKPRTYAKDFYIWQYLQQDITPDDAALALGQANNVNTTLFFEYAKKIKHDETYAVMQCMQAKVSELITTNSDCIAAGFSTYKATQLNYKEKLLAIEKLKEKYPVETEILTILNAALPFTKLTASTHTTFFKVFNACGNTYRERYFNYKLPKSTIKKLLEDDTFNKSITIIVTNPKLKNLQQSLLQDLDDTHLNHIGLFYLGLNALQYNKNDLALNYFNKAYKKAYFQFDKDKITFWKYQLTLDQTILEELSQSLDINIYSIFAQEFFNKKPQNIIYDIELKNQKQANEYNMSDPFSWIPIFTQAKELNEEKIHEYEELFNTKNLTPHLTYLYSRYFGFKQHYYITPFKEYLMNYNIDKQALIYAIARQESHFIPSSISSAYAIGVMQIMPFLSRHISMQLQEDYNLEKMFDVKTNLKYANHHLNYLQSHLQNPLFVAYAYNGGIGFTQRMLKSELFSKSNNKYEPYLSMELVPFDESRKYGKKVLANYYVYKNHLDEKHPQTLSKLIENLATSSQK